VLHLVEAGCVSVNLLSVVFLEKPLFIEAVWLSR